MKAVRIHSFGGPEVLQLDEIAIPSRESVAPTAYTLGNADLRSCVWERDEFDISRT